MHSIVAAGLLILSLGLGGGQTVITPTYNPTYLEFDPSVDHATLTAYRVEVIPGDTAQPIILAYDVPIIKVTCTGTPTRCQIQMAELPWWLPMGRSYRYQLSAVSQGQVGVPSDPSNVGRFSMCEVGGVVVPMTITVGTVPTLKVGSVALLPLTIVAPEPVHSVTVDLATDGQPAWYFVSRTDLRGTQQYAVGPFARAQTSLLSLEATDAAGCRTTVTPQTVTVVVQ
jgi:hypothetical protein